MKKVKQAAKWVKGKVMYQWWSLFNLINFKLKVRKAEKYHKLTGKRYHILPAGHNKLIIVDNTWVKHFNKANKGKAKKITIKDLLEGSYYSTSVQSPVRKVN